MTHSLGAVSPPRNSACALAHGKALTQLLSADEVVALAAGRAFFTRILDGLGVLADASARSMDEALRRALTDDPSPNRP